MASAQYLFSYAIDDPSDGAAGVDNPVSSPGPYTVAELDSALLPGEVNGSVESGEGFLIDVDGSSVDAVYTGYTLDGWPVYATDGGNFYVYSNVPLDNGDGTVVFYTTVAESPVALCLVAGALIAAEGSLVPVEYLAVGDVLLTPSGPRAVRFIGRTTRVVPELRATGRMPIRIEAGALGELGPEAPIHCTPSHAFLIGGCLVEAQALINGTTIRQLESWEEPTVTYYSIELEEHGLVWANGLLTETYFANVRGKGFSRESWNNHADYVALYGEGEPMKELELPRIPFARQLPAEIRQLAGVPDPAEAEAALYALS
jgi:hypothetical protein